MKATTQKRRDEPNKGQGMKSRDPNPSRLSSGALARLCEVTPTTIRYWVRSYEAPHRRAVGGGYWFTASEVARWMAARGASVPEPLAQLVTQELRVA